MEKRDFYWKKITAEKKVKKEKKKKFSHTLQNGPNSSFWKYLKSFCYIQKDNTE